MIPFLLGFFFYVLSCFIPSFFTRLPPRLNAQELSYNFSPELVRIISLDYKRMISSIIWIKTLIDADEEHYHKADGSWVFKRFYTILKLTPKNYDAAFYGGLYLSVVKDDLVGAKKIYEMGLVFYPDDYNLNYYYGMFLYTEMKDPLSAKPYLKKAFDLTNNKYKKALLGVTLSGIINKTQTTELALQYLENLKKQFSSKEALEKIDSKIQKIKSSIQR